MGETTLFAGAWRRLGAFVLDAVFLGLLGALAGYFLFDWFVALGAWGRLLGFLAGLAYFGVLNSAVGGGQTPGKRLLRIRVAGVDGAPLPLPRAMLRFAVLGTPWFLNGAPFPAEVVVSPLAYLLSLAVFGLGFAIVYLFLANRPTRRSLHDFAAGSFVVAAQEAAAMAPSPPRRAHLYVVGVLLLAAMAAPFVMKRLAGQQPLASLLQIYQAVDAEPGVARAAVHRGWSRIDGKRLTYLQVTAFLDAPRMQDADLAKRISRLAAQADASVKTLDVVQVALVYGYDIGIASAWKSQTYEFPRGAWTSVHEPTHSRTEPSSCRMGVARTRHSRYWPVGACHSRAWHS